MTQMLDPKPKPCKWYTLPLGRDSNGNDINAYEPKCWTRRDPMKNLPMKMQKLCPYCGGKVIDARKVIP